RWHELREALSASRRYRPRVEAAFRLDLPLNPPPIKAMTIGVELDKRIVAILRLHHGTTPSHASSAAGPWRENAPAMARASDRNERAILRRRLTAIPPSPLRPCRPRRRAPRQNRTL